jgi:ubiquinone/menaquinone biosynthesis C-methylase UbiE
MNAQQEGFRPIANIWNRDLLGMITFYLRLVLDLQISTIFRDLKQFLPHQKGQILDVGCGQSPYRSLLGVGVTGYKGIDIADADDKFDYTNPDIVPFDGQTIPFDEASFDAILCTEVLEHVFHYQTLVDEMLRVLRPGGRLIATIPWSARYHYIPFDFFRYTPSSLRTIFSKFSEVEINPRGNDIAVIANKLLVLWVRNVSPRWGMSLMLLPIWLLLSPLVLGVIIWAHIAIYFRLGSSDDPLGYTIIAKK